MSKILYLFWGLIFIIGCSLNQHPENVNQVDSAKTVNDVQKEGEDCVTTTIDSLELDISEKNDFKTGLIGKLPIPKFPIEINANYAEDSENKFKLIFKKTSQNWERKVATILKIAKCIEATAENYYKTEEFKKLNIEKQSEYRNTTQSTVQSVRLRAIDLTLKEHDPPINPPNEVTDKIKALKEEVKNNTSNESNDIIPILDEWIRLGN